MTKIILVGDLVQGNCSPRKSGQLGPGQFFHFFGANSAGAISTGVISTGSIMILGLMPLFSVFFCFAQNEWLTKSSCASEGRVLIL